MKLIDATPTSVHPSGTLGFCFTFGDPVIAPQIGVVYLGKEPRYTRFVVLADQKRRPACQPISERALTLDEIAHCEQLVRSESS